MFEIFIAAAFAASLNGDCYDKNSAQGCLALSQKLLSSKSPSDRARGEVARQKACKLGMSVACSPAGSPKVTEGKVETVSDTMTLRRSEVESQLINLPALLQDASMEERNPGFEFTQIEPKSVYEKLGFKVGDVLLEINGHTVESSADAMKLFMLLREEKNFAVKLKRAKKILTRKYEIKD